MGKSTHIFYKNIYFFDLSVELEILWELCVGLVVMGVDI